MKSKVSLIIVFLIFILSLIPIINCGTASSHENLASVDSTIFIYDNSSGSYHYVPPETRIELVSIASIKYDKNVIQPQAEGGKDSLLSKIKYPELAVRALVEGIVTCEFLVNSNGNTSNIKIKKGIGAHCDENVVDALKSQKFIPANKDGKNIGQLMRASFMFIIISNK